MIDLRGGDCCSLLTSIADAIAAREVAAVDADADAAADSDGSVFVCVVDSIV